MRVLLGCKMRKASLSDGNGFCELIAVIYELLLVDLRVHVLCFLNFMHFLLELHLALARR